MIAKEVGMMLKTIKSYYPSFVVNENVVEAWLWIFKDYEYEPIMASLNKYVKSNEYCPVPASIIKIYNEGKAKLDHAVGRDYGLVMELLTNSQSSLLRQLKTYTKKLVISSVMLLKEVTQY